MIDPDRYGPWAVVAGGSEGVGAEIALQLASAGVHLVLLARSPGPLAETAEKVREHGVEVRTLGLDLTADDALDRIAELTDDIAVGLLVVNAGANSYGHDFVSGDLDRFQRVIDLNITAQLALIHRFGGAMKERRRGGLVIVGSLAGYMGQAQIHVYSAVKAFSRVFCEGLWLELRDHDVEVLHAVLGVTRTPAMERAGLDFDAAGPNVAHPAAVASEILDHLGDGPVHIVAGNQRAAASRGRVEDRARLVAGAHDASRRLLPAASEH